MQFDKNPDIRQTAITALGNFGPSSKPAIPNLIEILKNKNENNQLRLFSLFSVLAVFVGCIGLYGLAALVAQQRIREIGLRKVHGASVPRIMQLLLWQFSKPVLASNFIAWPVSFYLMQDWLKAFPEHIGTVWLIAICLVTGLLAMLISWLTISSHALRVALASPIHALRHQ